ncbi:hypothetical protein [Paenibacillus koleovorans]|uniref:hypothetical protein n=1 Tax=Paenibacillus koleovorans TaxID=121608 RepID=UPI0013E3084C|nr:hypothetical protein [Paenibacillus koleovorans]
MQVEELLEQKIKEVLSMDDDYTKDEQSAIKHFLINLKAEIRNGILLRSGEIDQESK